MSCYFDIFDHFNEHDGFKDGDTLEMLRTMRVFLLNTPREVHGVPETLARALVAGAIFDRDEKIRVECRRLMQVLAELQRA